MSSHRVDFHDSITPAQARVLYHAERLLRSTGAMPRDAAGEWRDACARFRLDVHDVSGWTINGCKIALILLERTLRDRNIHLFRNISTGWESLT